MGLAVLILFYGSGLFCLIALTVMGVRYVRAPMHLHWELYRESSVYEQPDWPNKPYPGFGHKLKSVLWDVLSLREYFQRNRGFWYVLYPFHLGLYLLVVWHVWLFASAPAFHGEVIHVWGMALGYVATGLVFIGSIGILVRRLTDKDLKAYYPPVHYLKWLFIILVLAFGFYAVFFYFKGDFIELLNYVKHQLAFDFAAKLQAPVETSIHLLIVAPWLIYLPFSHMMRLFLRYYHHFRWDDRPNVSGSDVEKAAGKLLHRRVTWSAPHIQSGKTWAEVAVGMPVNMTKVEKK